MKKIRLSQTILLTLVGFCLIISGFAYLVIFFNIPYQDPTPELISKQNFHLSIGNTIMQMGGLVVAIGGVLTLAKFVRGSARNK